MLNINLKKAVLGNNLKEVRALLSAGVNPNVRVGHSNNDTLLHCASCAKIVNELLIAGARVNEINKYKEPPLQTAITDARGIEVVRELLRHGAAVDAINRKGNTALNLAVKKCFIDLKIIEELLRYGADINIENRERTNYENCYSPLRNATIHGSDRAKILIKYALLKNFEKDYRRIINLDYLRESIRNIFFKYLDDCVCEVLKMKTDEIKKGRPLYNFVKKNYNTNLISSYSLTMRLSKMDYSINYPIYKDVILYQIKPFLKRVGLLEKLKRIQIYALNSDEKEKNIILDTHAILFITEYISNDDMFNLIIASNFPKDKDEPDAGQDKASTSKDAKRPRLG